MAFISNLDLFSVGIAVAAMAVMGFSVLFNNYKSITNRTFFYFVILGIVWGVFHLMSYRITYNISLAFLFLKLELFLAVWYVFSIFRLFYVFPSEKVSNFPWWYRLLLVPIVIMVSLMTLTPLVFARVSSLSNNGSINTLEKGPGFFIFLTGIIFVLGLSFIIFFLKTKKAKEEEKSQFYLLLTGSVLTFALIIFFIPIQVGLFNKSTFIPFGAVFLLPFVLFASYAIIRHKLFNVRIAGTALLVFALSTVGFLEIVFAPSTALAVYRTGVLVLILVFGIFLIRGVLKEVEQKEEIAKMAEDVKRAYVVEKKAKEEMEKLDKFKDQFLMTTQHNLRTPLTSMMGYTDLILKGMFGKQNKKTIEVIKKFQNLTQHMIQMVNNFLDMAQFQLGKSVITMKPDVDLVMIVDEIMGELSFKAESRSLYLKFEKPAESFKIVADREKLKAGLFNVIDNAVKYTEKGGVDVMLEKPDHKVRLTVKDTGIGIKKEKLPTIFDETFQRSEEAKRVSSLGSGVGLYLSGQIIKAHNGKAWAESDGEGKGSTFIVELPLIQENSDSISTNNGSTTVISNAKKL